MEDTEVRHLDMGRRVRDFGAANVAAFPANSRGGELFALVAAKVGELEGHAGEQAAGNMSLQEGTAIKDDIRERLKERLRTINLLARGMSRTHPGIREKFRMPRGGDQAMLNAARAFVTEATPLEAEFIRRELPTTFLADFAADIEAFEASINQQNVESERKISARGAIRETIRALLDARLELDAIVQNKFRNDPATLAGWASARRVERPPKSKAAKPPGESAG